MSRFRAIFGPNETKSISAFYYEWKIYRNPFQQGILLLERDQDMVVGSISVTPKKLSIGGNILLGAELGDAYTHPDYQRKGIFTSCVQHCSILAVSQNIDVIYGRADPQLVSLYYRKLSYLHCSHLNVSTLSKHTNFMLALIKSLIKLLLFKRQEIPFIHLVKTFPKIIVTSLFSKFLSQKHQSFVILNVDYFPDDIDGYWGNKNRFVFLNVRDKTYLDWRFIQNPDQYQIKIAIEEESCIGYIVTKLSNNGKTGYICDFISKNDREDVFTALVKDSEKQLRKCGVKTIRTWSVECSSYYQSLSKNGYYDRGSNFRQPIIVYSHTKYGKLLLESKAPWHFTMADSDHI